MKKITVVILNSIAYSGTTWINALLSSHHDAFYLGPYQILEQHPPENACKIHYHRCPFWMNFYRKYNPAEDNFILKVAELSGKKFIVIQNPSPKIIENDLKPDVLEKKTINVVRDGRANVYSFIRHNPKRFSGAHDAVKVVHRALENKILNEGAVNNPLVRYEDFIHRPEQTIQRIGDHIGLIYPENFRRFWEFEMHMVAGNSGVLDLYRQMNGFDALTHRRSDYYADLTKKTKDAPDRIFVDESWKQNLTREDLFIIDHTMGDIQDRFGYERDRFSSDEKNIFRTSFR